MNSTITQLVVQMLDLYDIAPLTKADLLCYAATAIRDNKNTTALFQLVTLCDTLNSWGDNAIINLLEELR